MIVVIDNFLEKMDLEKYQDYVKNSGKSQHLIKDVKITEEFWSKYSSKCGDIGTEIYPYVTITNTSKPLARHKDGKLREERYKILIYLNEIENGGTIFYVGGEEMKVKNAENRMVIFDMKIEHESEKFAGEEKKMVIGFRLK